LVGAYDPLPIGYGKHRPGVKPADHALTPHRVVERTLAPGCAPARWYADSRQTV